MVYKLWLGGEDGEVVIGMTGALRQRMRFYFKDELGRWRDRHFKTLGRRKGRRRRTWRVRIKPDGPMTFLLGKQLAVIHRTDNRRDAYVAEKRAIEEAKARGETVRNDGYFDFIQGLRSSQREATHRGADQSQWKEDAFPVGHIDLHELLRSRRHAGLRPETLDKLRRRLQRLQPGEIVVRKELQRRAGFSEATMAKLTKAIEAGEVTLPDGIQYTRWDRRANRPATFRRGE